MDLNAFWALVESSAAESSGQDARLERLAAALAAMPPAEIVDFAVRLDEQRRATVFESVVSSPDAPADLPHVRFLASRGGGHAWADEDWPDGEGLDHVAGEAFGGDLESRGLEVPVSPEPAGEQWDFADPSEISARIPRLGALFGKVA